MVQNTLPSNRCSRHLNHRGTEDTEKGTGAGSVLPLRPDFSVPSASLWLASFFGRVSCFLLQTPLAFRNTLKRELRTSGWLSSVWSSTFRLPSQSSVHRRARNTLKRELRTGAPGAATICVWLVLLLAAAVCLVPTVPGAEPEGRIAIFKDDIPPAGAASSPDHLAGLLQKAGLATEFLKSEQLAAARDLNHDRFDVLVLPYGASFPVDAANNFRQFLRAGGKFLSTGGYAFDNLLTRTTNGWRAYQPPTAPKLDGAAWFYDIPAAELRGRGLLTFRGFLKADGVTGPGFAHFSVYQVAADGSLPTWRDVCQVRGTEDWKEQRFAFEVHPQATTVSLRAGLYRCRGSAWFDDVRLTDEAGKVLLEADFEPPLPPDRPGPRQWWRSHQEFCVRQSGVTHSGSNALKATLSFEIPGVERLNTRHGRPEDGLEVEPTQLGVFQADYPLERARFAAAAPMQSVVPPALHLDSPVEGWAACGVVGWDTARWMPLVNAYDAYGRLRGAAGAMLRHYAGPWAGSSWAFFGVTNRDLFASEQPAMGEVFVNITRALVRDTYFASLTTEQACYRPSESVKFLIPVFNGGRKAQELRIQLEIHPGEDPMNPPVPLLSASTEPSATHPAATLVFTVQALPRQTNLVVGEWTPPRSGSDFYHLVARLEDGTNEVDRIEGGFIVQDPKVVQSGPQLNFRDNYLRFGQRPLFLFGTDDWSYVFNTTRETPLQWLRDMRQRRDLGVLIYENLQFGLPSSPANQEQLLRKVDGVIQLAQKYGQVYFPGLLIGYNAAAGDSDLAAERSYCRDFARRYANIPGLIYYLNGDYRCDLTAAVTPQWNEFLRQRHGSDTKLREAWGRFAPRQPLGQIPAEDYHDWEQTWDDVSAYDRNCFRAWLMRRWNGALISGIRECDPAHPTSGEFYQLPHGGVDLLAGVDGLDLANFGFFEKPGADLAKFPALCLYNDQRARGKSGGPGEYGVKTHPAWGDGKDYGYHTARTREQALELFLGLPHYALGLGASRLHNWCWKDDAHRVFPWGMVYPCDGVPKDIACVHRNLSLLFRQLAPVYEAPQTYVLTPDSHRLGGAKWKVTDGILASFEIALAAHIPNLGTLNEQGLEIPKSAKAIFYPLPFCPSDEAYTKVLNWVKSGGVLYLSGDISYDELRHRSRTNRLEELCGVRFVAEYYPNLAGNFTNASDQPCIRVEAVDAEILQRAPDGSPLLVQHAVGRGRVFYNTDPVELHSTATRRAQDLALYRRVLETAGLLPFSLEPDDPRLHVMRLPLSDGGKVWIVFNTDETQPTRTFTLTNTMLSSNQTVPALSLPSPSAQQGERAGERGHQGLPMTLTVARHRPALLWFDGAGGLRAVEAQGACVVGNEQVSLDETRGVLLTLDGQDVRQSHALLLLPLQLGRMQWRSTVAWTEPTVEVGEIQGGQWQPLETQPARNSEGQMQLSVSSDQALSVLLVCEKSALGRWRQQIERGITNPGSLP